MIIFNLMNKTAILLVLYVASTSYALKIKQATNPHVLS
jgi:hypothetical protein